MGTHQETNDKVIVKTDTAMLPHNGKDFPESSCMTASALLQKEGIRER